MKKILPILMVLVGGCASHQYDGMQMSESRNGFNYNLSQETLTVQYQEYQFVPNTIEVLMKCRKVSKEVAKELIVIVETFDYVTERNEFLGITSCLAFGDLKISAVES